MGNNFFSEHTYEANQTNLIQIRVSHFIDCAQVLLDTYHVIVRGCLAIDGLDFKGVLGRR